MCTRRAIIVVHARIIMRVVIIIIVISLSHLVEINPGSALQTSRRGNNKRPPPPAPCTSNKLLNPSLPPPPISSLSKRTPWHPRAEAKARVEVKRGARSTSMIAFRLPCMRVCMYIWVCVYMCV